MAAPPPPPPPSVAPARLAGRYRLERRLASGGMAEVWLATDEVLARSVAIKRLHPHLSAHPEIAERFRREALAAARLNHPNVVAIFDTVTDERGLALIMEYVPGRSLRELLDGGSLSLTTTIDICRQVAEALAAAHRAGIVHRDIKPANILVAADGRVLVTDFGIARATAGADLTTDGSMVGTPAYLAPEQVDGRHVDARTDLYALGTVFYECACGRVPFRAATDTATALARLQRDPDPPRAVRPGIPRPVEDIILRLLARDPDERYPSAVALIDALARLDLPRSPVDTDATRLVSAGPSLGSPTRDGPLLGGATVRASRPEVIDLTSAAPSEPTLVRAERSWLGLAFVIVVVALTVGVAGLVLAGTDADERLVRFSRDVIDKVTGHEDQGATSTADPTGASTGAPAPDVGADLPADPDDRPVASIFDPAPGDGTEHDAELPNLFDRDTATSWATESYKQRDLGAKDGVGIVVRLVDEEEISKITLASSTTGWSVLVFVADDVPADLAGWGEPVGGAQHVEGTATVAFDEVTTRHVLVWFTDLGNGPPPFQVRIDELQVS